MVLLPTLWSELEDSNHAQQEIENTAKYWAMKEKEVANNYHCILELNNTVSNRRVQQLYSQNQPQEVIDQAKRQAVSARQDLEGIQRVEDTGLSQKPKLTQLHWYTKGK